MTRERCHVRPDRSLRASGDRAALFGRGPAPLAARLSPDHITPHAPLLLAQPGLTVAVVNPMPDLPRAPGAVCLGGLVDAGDAWGAPGSRRPDGSYAVCRWDAERLELVTDNLASRALWYVLSGDLFLASTSQRALVCLLGDLHFNDAAVAWLASSGTLGPDNAWDTRLRRVPAAAVLSLDRRTWTTQCTAGALDHDPQPLPDEVHLQRWREAILETCAELDVSLDTWLLPLSGGLDSRTLLAALSEAGRRPRCVTWGLRRSLDDPESDSVVARRLAEHYQVEHAFFPTDPGDEPARIVIDRFLVAGEGRTDQIAGYLDGLALWKTLFDDGVTGIIRGDEPGWGHDACYSTSDVRRGNRVETIADFPADHAIRQLGLASQSLPEWVQPRTGESLVVYDGRLTDYLSVPSRAWTAERRQMRLRRGRQPVHLRPPDEHHPCPPPTPPHGAARIHCRGGPAWPAHPCREALEPCQPGVGPSLRRVSPTPCSPNSNRPTPSGSASVPPSTWSSTA